MMFNIKINILVRLETKIHMVKEKNYVFAFFRGGGGGLAFFCQKTWGVAYTRGAAYTSEYGISTKFPDELYVLRTVHSIY